jgi:antitoxin component of MazEF toxin-antitoxin module
MSDDARKRSVRQKVFKAGNSLVVAVPASFRRALEIKVGDPVKVDANYEKHVITYEFSAPRQLSLIIKE